MRREVFFNVDFRSDNAIVLADTRPVISIYVYIYLELDLRVTDREKSGATHGRHGGPELRRF